MSLSSSARRILCMAVGRRIQIKRINPLTKPLEGKFRVKGRRARVGGLQRYFWTGMRLKAIKAGIFRIPDTFQRVSGFFRLAERARLSTMRVHKSSVFLAE